MYQTPQNPIHPGSYTTTSTGTPVASDDHSLTVGADGPIVLHDAYAVEKLAQFNRERVPERVVHAKGTGAYGYFELPKMFRSTPVQRSFSRALKPSC